MPTDRHKRSVSNGKQGREIMVENKNWALVFEFTNVAEIEYNTC